MSSPRGPRRHLSYANVMSTLAVVLMVAVGGTAAAGTVAKTVAKNTVTSKSIKDNTVTTKDVKDASLAGADVADASLAGADVADNSLTGSDIDEYKLTLAPNSVGSANVTNGSLTGTDLAAGSVTAGKLGTLAKFETTVSVAATSNGTAIANCPAGSVAISGGGRALANNVYIVALSRENVSEAWVLQAFNSTGSAANITAFVYCLAP
jgi:hypothetical protein